MDRSSLFKGVCDWFQQIGASPTPATGKRHFSGYLMKILINRQVLLQEGSTPEFFSHPESDWIWPLGPLAAAGATIGFV
jgi:hypothetical protein